MDPAAEMDWRHAVARLVFNVLGVLAVYALQRLQGWLPLNPAGLPGVAPDSALNTAISFVTNTNWHAGESTMSYLTQMLALTAELVSAATGIAVLIGPGNRPATAPPRWAILADLVRATPYVLPLSFILALALVSQGVVQNLDPYVEAHGGAHEKRPFPPIDETSRW